MWHKSERKKSPPEPLVGAAAEEVMLLPYLGRRAPHSRAFSFLLSSPSERTSFVFQLSPPEIKVSRLAFNAYQ